MHMNKTYLPLLAVLFQSAILCHGALPVPDPDDDGLILPPGFHALVYADNLLGDKITGKSRETLRGLVVAPNGDVYAKERRGQIIALRDTNGDGRADVIKLFGPGDGGTHVMFHNGYLYHSSTTAVYRYKYIPGELVPSSPMEVMLSGLPAKPGTHDQKAFAFDENGHMLVLIGAPFNVFTTGEGQGAKGATAAAVAKLQETVGGFWQFDADKTNQHFADGVRFTTGVRNCLALTWHPVSKSFFMCMMGRDRLDGADPDDYDALDNAERVAEEFHQLKPGENIGWPYSYWDPYKKARMLAPEYGGNGRKRADNAGFDQPLIAFPAHWSPLQMCLYDGAQFPERYRSGMFLAFHGSWNRAPLPQAGYKVVFIPFNAQGLPTGKWENFIEGIPGPEFYAKGSGAKYRPCGVAVGPDGSLYVSDTEKGRIWRIIYNGVVTPAKNSFNVPAVSGDTSSEDTAGSVPPNRIFVTVCAACHMADGRGVPNMHPPLAGSAVVAGDATQLINLLLKGPAAVLPADRPKYNNAMPAFNTLTDEDIAGVINYLRDRFAPTGAKVTPPQVAAQRAKL
jgi:glucose/arabinose dehydrogenase/mono/diheme cytochrome c family protein